MAETVVNSNLVGSEPYQWAKRPSRSLIVFSNTVLYDFAIREVTNTVICVKSIDAGLTWAELAPITTSGTAISFDIYYEKWTDTSFDPVVHVIAHVDAAPRGTIYARITLGTDVVSGEQTLKTWSAEPNGGHTGIVVDEAGNLHAFGFGPAIGTAYHFYSADGGATWTDTRSMAFTPSLNVRDLFSPWPDLSADPGDLMVVHGDFSAGGSLYLHRYDHSADTWSTTDIDTGFDYGETSALSSSVGFAFDRSNARLFVFGVHENDVSPATLNGWSIVGATVTALTDVVTETYLRCSSGSFLPNGDLLAAYSYDPSDTGPITGAVHGAFYKISDDLGATWGSEVEYSQFANLHINALFSDPQPPLSVLPIIYHDRDGDDDYIEAPLAPAPGEEEEPMIYRLMLATVEAPDTLSVNITPESVRAR